MLDLSASWKKINLFRQQPTFREAGTAVCHGAPQQLSGRMQAVKRITKLIQMFITNTWVVQFHLTIDLKFNNAKMLKSHIYLYACL